jgi:EAL domain-containing protein (putative c-di-GMP-specific phosphodiesterase class I)/GGDEF domain-containing protein
VQNGDFPGDSPRDALTGLASIDAARLRLAVWSRAAGEADGGASATGDVPRVHALMLGFRRFETINLAYGEAAGDGALVEIARRLMHFADAELDGPWLVARGGGGTFLVAANEACSRERWQLFAEQLADVVARPIERRAGTLRLSPRLALLRVLTNEDAESVLDRLAQTLAVAKHQQGRRVIWANGETAHAGTTAAQLEADLLRAIDAREIEVMFQPQFRIAGDIGSAGDVLSGAEALARWDHPRLGRIGAAALFAVAERADHVVPLSRHIAAAALRAAARWPDELRLSLNVTADDLAVGSFATELGIAIDASGFPRERLTLEVTEQVLVADMQLAERMLAGLAGQGIRIALDDFGAGFCNFRYLKTLPLHYLKLDRSMIDGIVEDPRDLAVLRAMVAMAGALDLEVIVEGIETEAQRAVIGREACGYYQGFLKAQPLSGRTFSALAGGRAAHRPRLRRVGGTD